MGKDRQGQARMGKDRQGWAKMGKDKEGQARMGKDRLEARTGKEKNGLGQLELDANSSG